MQFYFLLALYSVAAEDIQGIPGALYSDQMQKDKDQFCQDSINDNQVAKSQCLNLASENPNSSMLPRSALTFEGIICECPTKGKTNIKECMTYTTVSRQFDCRMNGTDCNSEEHTEDDLDNCWDCVMNNREAHYKEEAERQRDIVEAQKEGKTNIDVCKKYSEGDLYKWWDCVMKDLEAHYEEQAERQKKIAEAQKENGICPKDRFWTYFGGNNSGQWRIKTCLKNQFEVISDKTRWWSTPTSCYCPNLEISKEAALQCAVDHSSMFSAGSLAKALLWNDAIDNVAATIEYILEDKLNVDQVFQKIDYQKWYDCVKTQLPASDSRGPQEESKDIII